MMTFRVHFCRYADGENRISAPIWLQSENFGEASIRAHDMLGAMHGADPDRTYSIYSINAPEIHGRAVQCDGARMFETAAELAARA